MKLGPFFKINGSILYNAVPVEKCEKRGGKMDNPFSHQSLFEDKYGAEDEYIDYPRGRVIWDTETENAIIYIDPCINDSATVGEIVKLFELGKYTVQEDIHYHCRMCSNLVWED